MEFAVSNYWSSKIGQTEKSYTIIKIYSPRGGSLSEGRYTIGKKKKRKKEN